MSKIKTENNGIVRAESVAKDGPLRKRPRQITAIVAAMKAMKPGDAFKYSEFHGSYVTTSIAAINAWTGSDFFTFTGNDGFKYISLE